jgi:hypothetical protein
MPNGSKSDGITKSADSVKRRERAGGASAQLDARRNAR